MFTLNNYTDDEVTALNQIGLSIDTGAIVRFIIWGKEIAPSTRTPHLQGYVEFTAKRTPRQVHDVVGQRAWVEPRRGTQEQAIQYCKKEGDFTEFGTASTGVRPAAKKKMTMTEMAEYEKENGLAALAESALSHSDFKGYFFRRQFIIKPTAEFRKVDVKWFFGATGTGKTRCAMHEIKESGMDVFVKMGGTWFDGYQGEEVILMDDLRENDVDFNVLLRLTGGYSGRYPVKGSSVVIHPKVVYITAPSRPHSIFRTSDNDSIAQLERRITDIREFQEEWLPPVEEAPLTPQRGEIEMNGEVVDLDAIDETMVSLFGDDELANVGHQIWSYPVRGLVTLPSHLQLPPRCPAGSLPSPTQLWDGLVSSDEE
jgi:hypothetical protein